MLEKIRQLPEAKRKMIFWIGIVAAAAALIIWFLVNTASQVKGLW